MKLILRLLLCALILSVAADLCVGAAYATTGPGLAWEDPLSKLTESITGPVAYGISALMLVAGAAGVAFGGDISGWLRYVLIATLVIGCLGFIIPLLGSLFGVTAAVII